MDLQRALWSFPSRKPLSHLFKTFNKSLTTLNSTLMAPTLAPRTKSGTEADAITWPPEERAQPIERPPAQAFIRPSASLSEDYVDSPKPLDRRRSQDSPRNARITMTTTNEATSSSQSDACKRDTILPRAKSSRSLLDTGSLTDGKLSRSPNQTLCSPRHTSETTLDDLFSPRSTDSSSLHDMLCNAKATVVTAPTSQDAEEWSEERDNSVLRDYFRGRTNIVLNSLCPEVAPHIVVTPVLDTTLDFYTPWNNRVDYIFQDNSLLTAPGYDTTRSTRMPGLPAESYWPVAPAIPTNHGSPRRVWKRSRCHHRFSRSEQGPLNMHNVDTALQRHQVKAAAIAASILATELKKRYDDLSVFASVEKPFKWTDPAEPILKCVNWPGVVVFESHNPFVAPHIMLCTPPQQDPWIPFANATNDPQDGRYLYVPSRLVNFINVRDPRFDDYDDSLDELESDYSAYSETDTPPETPEPETPIDLEDGEYFPTRRWDLDEESDSLIYETSPAKWSNDCDNQIKDLPPRPSRPIFYVDDEEDEELPPLDDWYLSVASRNGLQISA